MNTLKTTTETYISPYLPDHNYSAQSTNQCTSSYESQTSTTASKHTEKRKHIQTTDKPARLYSDRFVKTAVPIKLCYIPYDITTNAQRKALLAIQHKPLTKEQRTEIANILSRSLDRVRKKNLVYKDRPQTDYTSHRIIYVRTPKHKPTKPDPNVVWNEVFVSQKNDLQRLVPPCINRHSTLYKQKLCLLLSKPFLSLFHKIETFSITHTEYSDLKSYVRSKTIKSQPIIFHSFFPGIIAINNKERRKSMSLVPEAYVLAARAHFKISQTTPRKASVLTDEQTILVDKLNNECCSSLKEIEYAASILQRIVSPSSLLQLIHKAVQHMENAGLLPIPPEDFNDPYLVKEYEMRNQQSVKEHKLRKSNSQGEEELVTTDHTYASKEQNPNPTTSTSNDWTKVPPTSTVELEFIEQLAIEGLLALQHK